MRELCSCERQAADTARADRVSPYSWEGHTEATSLEGFAGDGLAELLCYF